MNKLVFGLASISVPGLSGTVIYYREPLFGTVDFSSDEYQHSILVNDEFLNTRVSSKSVFSQEEQKNLTREWQWKENGVTKTLKITNGLTRPDSKGKSISAFSIKFKDDLDKQVLLIIQIYIKSKKLEHCFFSYFENISSSRFLTIPKFENGKSTEEFKLDEDENKSKNNALSNFYKNFFNSAASSDLDKKTLAEINCTDKKNNSNITIT